MDNFVTTLKTWIAKPFNPNGNVLAWFLFLGLVIVLCLIWRDVLSHLKPVATAAAEAV